MPGLNVLVLGDSPRATELLSQIDADDQAHRQPAATADLPDLVVLAGSDESDLMVALHLLESGRPLVLVAGSHLTSAIVHRLGLVSEEAGIPIRCWLPAVTRLGPVVDDRRSPGEKALRLDRAENGSTGDLLFDDLALLGHLVGRFDQVTATLGPTATVTLETADNQAVTWTLRPTSGTATATLLVDDQSISLKEPAPQGSLDEWATVVAGGSHLPFESLVDLVEAFEAIEDSARRRRTIDLHHEPTSERTVFKSQMTTVGCLLLMLTLAGFVALLVLGAVLDPTSTRAGRAARVGFLVVEDEFRQGTPDLTDAGKAHLEQVSGRFEHVHVPIVIAATGNAALDVKRLATIHDGLVAAGHADFSSRVVIDIAPQRWKHTVLQIARVAWLAPLVLFLLLQCLILATHKTASRPDAAH